MPVAFKCQSVNSVVTGDSQIYLVCIFMQAYMYCAYRLCAIVPSIYTNRLATFESLEVRLMLTSSLNNPKDFSKAPWLEYLFIADCLLAQILTQAGSIYCLSILKVLQEFYGIDADNRGWFLSSFALAVGTFIIISGRLGDIYGVKRLTIIGYLWMFLWSVLGAVAYYVHNPIFLFCTRAFQGLGCGLVLPNVLAAIGRTYKQGTFRKHIIFSLMGWAAPIGGSSGVFFAGLIAVKTRYWNWVIWSYAIACLIGAGLTAVSFPDFDLFPQAMDWIGSGLLITGMVLFNFVWNQAPGVGWSSPYIITLLVVGLAVLAAFVVWELHFASNPIIPEVVIKNTRLMICLLALFFSWGTFGITLMNYFSLNIFFRNYSPLGAGATTLVASISGGVAAVSCSFLIRIIPIELLFVFAMASFLGSALIVATTPIHQTYWRNSFGAYILAPFGMDFSFPSAMIILSDSLPMELQGICSSLLMTVINYGIAEFIGMAATVNKQVLLSTHDELLALRSSQYLAVGLSAISIVIGLILFQFYRTEMHFPPPEPAPNSDEKQATTV